MLNPEKINLWLKLKKEEIISPERYNAIRKEWGGLYKKKKMGELSDEEFNHQVGLLREEVDKCAFCFKSDAEFMSFCLQFYKRTEMASKTIRHELQHAEIYKKYGLNYRLGFHKFWATEKNEACYMPFTEIIRDEKWQALSEEEQERIKRESLENVEEKSISDQEELEEELK